MCHFASAECNLNCEARDDPRTESRVHPYPPTTKHKKYERLCDTTPNVAIRTEEKLKAEKKVPTRKKRYVLWLVSYFNESSSSFLRKEKG
jgi:hypothetical protein